MRIWVIFFKDNANTFMKILLSTSPHIRHSAVLEADFRPRNDLMYRFAPLCLLMLAEALRAKTGETIKIYDINEKINSDEIKNDNSFYKSIAKSIRKLDPDVLGFMTECDSFHHILQICIEFKKISPDCHIMLGGPHATAVAEETMEKWSCIDSIVMGEGEITFCELIEVIAKGDDKSVAGAIVRNKKGQIIKGKNRSLIENLDELPFPAYDLYIPAQGEELFLEAGRGCPFQCTFCSTSPFWHRRHRVKSARRIIEEIRFIKKLHPDTERFHFTHDLFTANQNWVKEVCEALIQAKLGVKWTCSSRIDTVNDELLTLMAQAGCNAIYFGIESGSDKILQSIKKEIPFSITVQIIQKCNELNITPNAGLIIGFPGEDDETITETFSVYEELARIGTKPLHLFSYCPFAQSSLYVELEELVSTGHFLDIPLSPHLNASNRKLIADDPVLFGSYFKPLSKEKSLNDGVLYALDEFSILADALRISVLLLGERLSIKDLFFKWINYISLKNEKDGTKEAYRKYMGSPVDFCSFLIEIDEELKLQLPWFRELLLVQRMNFNIAAELSLNQPVSMATYRSKTLPSNFSHVSFDSLVSSKFLMGKIQLNFNILPLLEKNYYTKDMLPEQEKTNLVWQFKPGVGISLLQVSDFIYSILSKVETKHFSVDQLVNDWINDDANIDVNVADLILDIQDAVTKKVLNFN